MRDLWARVLLMGFAFLPIAVLDGCSSGDDHAAVQKDDGPIAVPVTFDGVRVPSESPERLFTDMDGAAERARQAGLNAEDVHRYNLFFALKAAEHVIADVRATQQQKEEALRIKVVALYQAKQSQIEGFSDRFDQIVDDLIAKEPESRATELGVGYRLADKYFAPDASGDATTGDNSSSEASDKAERPAAASKLKSLPEAAVTEITEYCKKHPLSPIGRQLIAQLGATLTEQERYDEADKVFRVAINVYLLSEDSPLFFNALGNIYKRQGRIKEAIATYEEAARLFKGRAAADDIDRTLKSLARIGMSASVEGPALTGEMFDLKTLKGKVVLVDFWATWCAPCVAEIPNLKDVYRDFHDKGFEIVGISLDHTKQELEAFVKQHDLQWTQIYFDEPGKSGFESPLAQRFGIDAIPASLLVGKNGVVVDADLRGRDALEQAVRKALGESP